MSNYFVTQPQKVIVQLGVKSGGSFKGLCRVPNLSDLTLRSGEGTPVGNYTGRMQSRFGYCIRSRPITEQCLDGTERYFDREQGSQVVYATSACLLKPFNAALFRVSILQAHR